jgi:hypothetical protein
MFGMRVLPSVVHDRTIIGAAKVVVEVVSGARTVAFA